MFHLQTEIYELNINEHNTCPTKKIGPENANLASYSLPELPLPGNMNSTPTSGFLYRLG